MGEVFVRLVDGLPPKCPGLTIEDEEGNYNVYLSSDLTQQGLKETLDHELAHIQEDHFHSDKPVCECEREADIKKEPETALLLFWEEVG